VRARAPRARWRATARAPPAQTPLEEPSVALVASALSRRVLLARCSAAPRARLVRPCPRDGHWGARGRATQAATSSGVLPPAPSYAAARAQRVRRRSRGSPSDASEPFVRSVLAHPAKPTAITVALRAPPCRTAAPPGAPRTISAALSRRALLATRTAAASVRFARPFPGRRSAAPGHPGRTALSRGARLARWCVTIAVRPALRRLKAVL